jgi:(1->4)-alpha-D-glucan 1-alpha-D-glucosylmutase
MLNTSTHDSKRSEDVRARISVLSEIPDIWSKMIRRWSRLNRQKKQHLDTIFAPSKNDEYALYQILIGAWPFQDGEDVETGMSRFSKRVQSYMIKAVREAKVHSSWLNPNEEYEDAVVGFVRSILEPRENNRLFHEFLSFQRTINRFGLLNSLSQTLLKLTVPGVPDIYQGNEVWHLALVDPDNRRPVDFQTRRDMLQALQTFVSVPTEILVDRARELFQTMEDGRIKLYVIWKTLGLRWRYEKVFRDGAYIPLATHGEKVEYLCAFARQHEGRTIIVVAPRLYARLCGPEWKQAPLGKDVWSDTWIEVPVEMGSRPCHNLFTGEQLRPDISDGKTGFSAGVVLAHFPVALLTTEQSGSL